MKRTNLEKAERCVLEHDRPMPCPSCGDGSGASIDSLDVELGEGDSISTLVVYGRASCGACLASWRFEGLYTPIHFQFDVDDWGDGRDGAGAEPRRG